MTVSDNIIVSGDSMKKEFDRILKHKGSTTYLLEDILNCKLEVHVSFQRWIKKSEINSEIIKFLYPDDNCLFLERYSNLSVTDRAVITSNYVLFKVDSADMPLMQSLYNKSFPIGKILLMNSIHNVRELIDYGQMKTNTFNGHTTCFYKKYLIRLGNNSCLFIHERFHPKIFEMKVNNNADIQ